MGRYRNLTKYFVDNKKSLVLQGLRAAINTPIQGGAADIVIAAMVKLFHNQEIKDLKWSIIHQVHDEIILEGPQESAKRVA